MKNYKFIVLLLFSLFVYQPVSGQFSVGIKSSVSSLGLDVNFFGLGPYVTMESRRILFQLSYVRFFNENTVSGTGSFEKTTKIKPSEIATIFGIKINPDKPIVFIPFIGASRYSLGIEITQFVTDRTINREDQIGLWAFYPGLQCSYYYKNFNFFIDAKIMYLTATDIRDSGFGIGFGMGYRLPFNNN